MSKGPKVWWDLGRWLLLEMEGMKEMEGRNFKGEHYSKTIFSTVKIYLTTSILADLFLHKSASFNRKKT